MVVVAAVVVPLVERFGQLVNLHIDYIYRE
jgi:hypothetical protein